MENIKQDDYQRIANKLPTLSVIFIVVIALGFLFMKAPNMKFRLTPKQMLDEVLSYKDAFGPEKVSTVIFSNDSMYQFIDLRSPKEFIKGHLPNAINIPVHQLFAKEFEKVLNQDKKINILYGATHIAACGPWMLLKQLGYKNNKVLLGGYDFVKSNIMDNFSPMNGQFKDEQPKYDFAKIVSQTPKGNVPVSSGSIDKSAPVIKKTKKAGSGGGC
jgi:rhodanese-related sulfurtransferase